MDQIGAFWKRQSKKGTLYLSGVVEVDGKKIQAIIFKNERKREGKKDPDWKMFLSEQRGGDAKTESDDAQI